MQCYALQTINCPALVQNAQLLISDRVWTQRGTLHIYSWKITHVHINLIKKKIYSGLSLGHEGDHPLYDHSASEG